MANLLAKSITVSPKVVFQALDQEAILLDLQAEIYYGLDEIGAYVWQQLAQGAPLAGIVEALAQLYDVPLAQLTEDVEALLAQLAEAKLIQVTAT